MHISQALSTIMDMIKAPVAREKCLFPHRLAEVFGGFWLLVGDLECKEGTVPEKRQVFDLIASRLPQLPVAFYVCLQTTS